MIPITKPFVNNEETLAAQEVISSGWLSQGPKVAEFETNFADLVNSKHAIATSSCTTALHLALIGLNIGHADEVIVPSLSFIASANSIRYCGATPVFVDIDPNTCNIDTTKISKLITNKTRAIMTVHQMGLPSEIDEINRLANENGISVIEDAACAIGSTYKDRVVGSHGNIACFSFHPRKIITTGEGGMITTDDDRIADRLRRLRQHGMSLSDIERHRSNKVLVETYPEIGFNYRMTDIQAAVGLVQLKKLSSIIEARRKLANIYNESLINIPGIRIPKFQDHLGTNYQSYWLEILPEAALSRNELMQKLLERNISTRRGIMAIHLEDCYSQSAPKHDLVNTDRITRNTMIIPLYPEMTESDQKYVINNLIELLT